ncbi:MAG: ribonuclease D, partial [Litorivicinaceae bacterium]|nr:ribonuclease D [Litorivicinaceae bacterium]
MRVVGWIDHQAELDALVEQVADADAIGLDTEFVRVSTFHPKPGLIQIALQ